MGVSNEQLDVLSQKINEQEFQIFNLQAKINELTIENQKLDDENVKLKSAVENLDVLIE
jgi:regulator of replication initiation timing